MTKDNKTMIKKVLKWMARNQYEVSIEYTVDAPCIEKNDDSSVIYTFLTQDDKKLYQFMNKHKGLGGTLLQDAVNDVLNEQQRYGTRQANSQFNALTYWQDLADEVQLDLEKYGSENSLLDSGLELSNVQLA